MSIFTTFDNLCGKWLDYRTNQALEQVPVTGLEFFDIHANKKGVELLASHPVFASLAVECTDMLAKENAKNYLEMEVMPRLDRGTRAFVITIAFKDGEAPGHKAARLEVEVTRLAALVDSRTAALEKIDKRTYKYFSLPLYDNMVIEIQAVNNIVRRELEAHPK